MRIEHSRLASDIANTEPPLLKASGFISADHCSLASLKSHPKNRIFFVFKELYYKFLDKWNRFYNWLTSLFIPEEEEEEVTFIAKDGAAAGEKHYTYVEDGKTKSVELNIGPTTADLRDVAIPKEKNLKQFFRLIDEVMENRQISTFKVKKLAIANHLWKSGLRTENLVQVDLGGHDEWNKGLLKMLQKASAERDKLSETGDEAFFRIQQIMVKDIITEELEAAGYDVDACKGEKSLVKIDRLEDDSGIYFDLKRLAKEADQSEYQDLLWKVCDLRDQKVKIRSIASSSYDKIELPLEDLLILINETKTKFTQMMVLDGKNEEIDISRSIELPTSKGAPVSFTRSRKK